MVLSRATNGTKCAPLSGYFFSLHKYDTLRWRAGGLRAGLNFASCCLSWRSWFLLRNPKYGSHLKNESFVLINPFDEQHSTLKCSEFVHKRAFASFETRSFVSKTVCIDVSTPAECAIPTMESVLIIHWPSNNPKMFFRCQNTILKSHRSTACAHCCNLICSKWSIFCWTLNGNWCWKTIVDVSADAIPCFVGTPCHSCMLLTVQHV